MEGLRDGAMDVGMEVDILMLLVVVESGRGRGEEGVWE